METLIEDLKKVMNSEIEYKDKYMKMLINGFLRERDSELLTIQGVVKSLKAKEKLNFDKWKFSKGIRYVSGHTYKDNDGDLYDSDELEKMYQHYLSL